MHKPCSLLAVALTLTACTALAPAATEPSARPLPTPAEARRQLQHLVVLDSKPYRPGYDRICKQGHACTFGPDWNDDVDVAGGHNGCDTRNDRLAAELRDVRYRTGSRCVVVSGVLDDPYTGTTISFEKTRAGDVQVDHAVPLLLAYVLGAPPTGPSSAATISRTTR